MAGIPGGITDVDLNNLEINLEIEALARFAVEDHNKKENATLKFVDVVKAKQQVVAGTLYYITIEAANGDVKKKYDAKVWVKPWMDFKEVEEFKEHVGDATGEASA